MRFRKKDSLLGVSKEGPISHSFAFTVRLGYIAELTKQSLLSILIKLNTRDLFQGLKRTA